MNARPTRATHLEECRVLSIALTQYVKEMYERYKFHCDLWEPRPMPPDWDGA